MSDAVSHAVLPGIVIAHIVHLPFALGAFIAGILCAVATGFFAENSRLKEDTVMGNFRNNHSCTGFSFTQST